MVKVIIFGATGFVGGQVLKTAVVDNRISSIVVLSRKALATTDLTNHPKVNVIIRSNFEKYPEEILGRLRGAVAVIWCIGGMVRDFDSVATARRVQADLARSTAETFVEAGILPLRFVFCSGAFAERDQNKKLWFLVDTRKIKGEAEQSLAKIQVDTKDFKAFHLRFGGILPLRMPNLRIPGFLRVDRAASVLMEIAIHGHETEILENRDILRYHPPKQDH